MATTTTSPNTTGKPTHDAPRHKTSKVTPTTTTTSSNTTVKSAHHIPKLILKCTNEALRRKACKVFEDPNSTKQKRDEVAFLCIDFTEKEHERKKLTQNLEYYDIIQTYVYDNRSFFNTVGFPGSFVLKDNISFMRNGTIITSGVDPFIYNVLHDTFPCAVFMSIFTDDENGMGQEIDEFTKEECKRWRGMEDNKNKCFILSEHGLYPFYYLPFSTTTDQFISLVKNRKRHTTTKSSALYQPKKALRTKTPTTPSPVISGTCSERKNPLDCIGNCRYFGVIYKCQDLTYCEFKTDASCRSNPKYCHVHPHTKKCVWK